MARIVRGFGCSHSPQLGLDPQGWKLRADIDDRRLPWTYLRSYDGTPVTYDDLLAQADTRRFERELSPEVMEARHQANQRGLARVAAAMHEASLDALIMFGDDQQEAYSQDNMPALAIYVGDTIHYEPYRWPYEPKYKTEVWNYGTEPDDYPGVPDLAAHAVEYLTDHDFDVTVTRAYELGQGMSHAFSFVFWQLLKGVPIPAIPVHINTYFPPNRPSPIRSYLLGRAIRKAVEAWPEDLRVGTIASGGLSHFVVDEELDDLCIKALWSKDINVIGRLPLERLYSGNSEIRNWLAVAGASEHLEMNLFDYVPCYRSLAGTGCAMGFAEWK